MKTSTYLASIARRRKGVTLVELLFVVFIVGVMVTVIAGLLIQAMNTSAYVSRRNEVSYSLQQAVELFVDDLRENDEVVVAGDDDITVLHNGERISYYFDSGEGKLYRDDAILAEDITAVKLIYLDGDGYETTQKHNMMSMDVIIYGEVQGQDWVITSNVSFRRRPR